MPHSISSPRADYCEEECKKCGFYLWYSSWDSDLHGKCTYCHERTAPTKYTTCNAVGSQIDRFQKAAENLFKLRGGK